MTEFNDVLERIKERENKRKVKELQEYKRKLRKSRNTYKKYKNSSIRMDNHTIEGKKMIKEIKDENELKRLKRKNEIKEMPMIEKIDYRYELVYLLSKLNEYVSIKKIRICILMTYGKTVYYLNDLTRKNIIDKKIEGKNIFFKINENGLNWLKNHTGIKNLSETMRKITDILKENDYTRRELVKKLKIPRTTIFDNLKSLENLNLVCSYSVNDGNRGRPLIYWKLNKERS